MGGETLERNLNNFVGTKIYAVLDGCYICGRGECGSCSRLIIVKILFHIDLAVFTTAVQD